MKNQPVSVKQMFEILSRIPLTDQPIELPDVEDLPSLHTKYVTLLSGNLQIDPRRGTIYLPPPPPTPIAAGEEASIRKDTDIEEPDGGQFKFHAEIGKTYNLINDTGMIVNAKFGPWKWSQKRTAIAELGLNISGPQGTSLIRIDPERIDKVTVNGEAVKRGKEVTLADGGTLTFSKSGQEVVVRTAEGYVHTVQLRGRDHLDYEVRSPGSGVNLDGRLPGGLLGATFDAGGTKQYGGSVKQAVEEARIDGLPADFEVAGGVFGFPKPQVLKPSVVSNAVVVDPLYPHHFDIPVGTPYALIDPEELRRQWEGLLQETVSQSVSQAVKEASLKIKGETKEKTKKLELLLLAALKGGNFDTAILMLSALETREANGIAGQLVMRIQKLQEERRDLAEQMGKPENSKNPGKLSELNTKAGDIGTEISLLQTFLQDAISTKKEAQELASQVIRSSHETARAIIQNIGR